MAIIRLKPKFTTARSFTLELSRRLEKEETSWKKKALLLEEELLSMKQDLLQQQLGAVSITGGEGGGGEDKDMEFSFAEGDRCSRILPDHYTGQLKSVERKEILRIKAHVNFLVNVSKVLNTHKKLSALQVSGLQDTFKDTILSAIGGLKESLSNYSCHAEETLRSQNMLTSAVSCITDMISLTLLAPVRDELVHAVISLVDVMLKERNNILSVQFLQILMVSMCGTHRILLHVVKTLTTQLCTSAQLIISTLQGKTCLGGDLIDTVERETAILDVVLAKYDSSKNFEDTVRFNMAHQLEDAFLELSCSYPLLTYGIWRIISMLTK